MHACKHAFDDGTRSLVTAHGPELSNLIAIDPTESNNQRERCFASACIRSSDSQTLVIRAVHASGDREAKRTRVFVRPGRVFAADPTQNPEDAFAGTR